MIIFTEQEKVRRDKIREMGLDRFGERFEREDFLKLHSFLQYKTGKIILYISINDIGEDIYNLYKTSDFL